MSYYDKENEYKEKGIDYDLVACLEYNPQPFTIDEVEKVVAVFEGERDEENWRWVLKLTKDGKKKHDAKFVYLEGGCDYTGWDCRSSADCKFENTALKSAEHAKTMYGYRDEVFLLGVYNKLVEQIKSSKSKTWREEKETEFQNDLPKL